MLLAIVGYAVLTVYAYLLWSASTAFQGMGHSYRKLAIPSLALGCVTFSAAEMWLISEMVDFARDGRDFVYYMPAVATTILSVAITAWAVRQYSRVTKKIAVIAMSGVAIAIPYML